MATILRPSVKKVLLISLLKTMSTIIVLIILFLIVNWLGFYKEYFTLAISVLVALGFIFLLIKYIKVKSVSYWFGADRLLIKGFVNRQIMFHQVVKVVYEKRGFFEDALDLGKIRLDMSRSGHSDIIIPYMERPTNVVRDVKELLRNYHVKEQKKFVEKHKMDRMLS
ncbi:hypothetical protein HQ533_00580 [Candidatus Woesearchaeota archaeon]|nr:hypothetical protein [Candidatus Woesearchaeota archaeon]